MYVESFTILPHFNYLGVGFITRNEEYTKHYYIEGERVCSKIGGGFGVAPQSPTGPHLSFIEGDVSSVRGNLKHLVFDDLLCVGYNNIWNMLSTLPPALNTANNPENIRYFYHPDHLGSSSMISNISGRADQHIQYLPFGELFVSQRNSSFDSRYKFTAKELDNETNYTYFGARYYDSDLSNWLSVDPMSDKYPSLSPYNYCANNPVILVDPDGNRIVIKYVNKNGNKRSFVYRSGKQYKGNDEFVSSTINAIEYIKDGDNMRILTKFEKSLRTIKIKEGADIYDLNFNDKEKTIYFSPNSGCKNQIEVFDPNSNSFYGDLEVTGYTTPALALLHEFGHGFIEFFMSKKEQKELRKPDSQYKVAEEKWVIEKVEIPAAILLDEGIRLNYEGEPYETKSSTTTDPK